MADELAGKGRDDGDEQEEPDVGRPRIAERGQREDRHAHQEDRMATAPIDLARHQHHEGDPPRPLAAIPAPTMAVPTIWLK